LSEQGKYRKWTAQQKLEIVVAGLRGDRSARAVCREHRISETLYCGWRDKLFEGGKAMLAGQGGAPRASVSCAERSPSWSGRSGRKTYELELAGKLVREWE